MPELPEVETVRRGLSVTMEGRILKDVVQNRPDLRFPFPERFVQRLTGQTVERIERRAKYLLIMLSSGEVLGAHLGMSGRFIVTPVSSPGRNATGAEVWPPEAAYDTGAVSNRAHDHVVFTLDSGDVVTFNDPRRFGYMFLEPSGALSSSKHLAALGPEPLSDAFNPTSLTHALESKRTPIKAALLDQRVVSGLGNIYVCEALFRSGISPVRSAHTIKGVRAERLVAAIKQVLEEAIDAGGSTLRDYIHTDGGMGYFQHRFAVYGREGETCPGCTCDTVIKRIVQSGRSTFYCARRQR